MEWQLKKGAKAQSFQIPGTWNNLILRPGDKVEGEEWSVYSHVLVQVKPVEKPAEKSISSEGEDEFAYFRERLAAALDVPVETITPVPEVSASIMEVPVEASPDVKSEEPAPTSEIHVEPVVEKPEVSAEVHVEAPPVVEETPVEAAEGSVETAVEESGVVPRRRLRKQA